MYQVPYLCYTKDMKFEKILMWIGFVILAYFALIFIQKQIPTFFPQTTEKVTEVQKSAPFSDADFVRAGFVRVVDGDTLLVDIGGEEERVRLIGVDAPETTKSHKAAECFGEESKDFLIKKLAKEEYLYLEFDDASGRRDRYGRLLAHVFNHDAQNINFTIIEQGYAHEYTYRRQEYLHKREYKQAQKQAERFKRGLWADDICTKNL